MTLLATRRLDRVAVVRLLEACVHRVAGGAQAAARLRRQARVVRSVRVVAGRAAPLDERRVLDASLLPRGQFRMALVAQLLRGPDQKGGVAAASQVDELRRAGQFVGRETSGDALRRMDDVIVDGLKNRFKFDVIDQRISTEGSDLLIDNGEEFLKNYRVVFE